MYSGSIHVRSALDRELALRGEILIGGIDQRVLAVCGPAALGYHLFRCTEPICAKRLQFLGNYIWRLSALGTSNMALTVTVVPQPLQPLQRSQTPKLLKGVF